jgi:IPT/TIG domain
VATVSTGSSSGVAEIQQSTGTSNSVPFSINTAMISGISPACGLPGTQVTITGSGFGTAQGNGNVWLGTIPALVNSWSDGQIIATVASGAASGSAQVLQNGVMSNAVPFTINLPQITTISPNNGALVPW